MDAHALRVRWQKARHYFSSLFRELELYQKEVGNEAFADWCFKELGISVGVLKKTTTLLNEVDARIAREALQASRAAELRKKMRERIAQQIEKERQQANKIKQKKLEKKRKNDRNYRKRKREKAKLIQLAAE